MRTQHLLFLLFFVAIGATLSSQPRCYFEHYGADDGLPQHTIMNILQDKKGFMWFSTWDGLSKFDGYNFYSYKIQAGDTYHMRSNRIDYIGEDKYGYIWTLSYDKEAHRFDPKTEKFMGIRSLEEYKNFTFTATAIVPTPSGRVWLTSEKNGCISITGEAFDAQFYNHENKRIEANHVYTVYEDSLKKTWLLTDNGLYRVSEDGKQIQSHFSEKEYNETKTRQNFYSCIDLKEQLWFGSDNGRIWIYNKKDGQFNLFETHSPSPIKILKNIDNNQLLIATLDDGFFIHNLNTKELKKFTTANLRAMPVNEIISCYIDKSKNIWLELNCRGVSRFDTKTQMLKHLSPKTEIFSTTAFPPNFLIFEDNENRIWVHPRGGGFSLYDPIKETLAPFYNEPSSNGWRFSDMIHAGFSDKQGNLWLGTRSYGLEKIIFFNDVFKSTIVDKNVHSTINNDVRCIFEDSDQLLWVSTKGGKIFLYDSNKNQLGYLCKNGKIEYGDPINGICYSMVQDDEKNIWIGTRGEGIYKLTAEGNGGTKYKITQYKNTPSDLYSLSNNHIYSIFQDKKRRIWIGTYGGGLNLVDAQHEGRFYNYKNNLRNYPNQFGSQVRIISSDKFGNICVGTTFGLILFSPDFDSVTSINYQSYTRLPNNNTSLRGNDIYDICTTQSGDTYLATFGGGLNKIAEVDKNGFPQKFTSYTTLDGLPSDVILTITEDYRGQLWITTEGNLTKFDPTKKTFETYSEINRLLERQNFSEGARYKGKSDIIYFGFSKGFISVNPDKIDNNTFKPYVALTNFKISNKDVGIDGDSPLALNIDDAESVHLSYKQNFISIEFAALDYIEPKRIMYAYKLDGFDDDWIVTQNQRIANYTNLSPGKYTFRVKSTNSDGIWVDNEHILKVEITPSFWQTKWAYFLYFILFITILYIILRAIVLFYRLRDKVKMEHEQTEMKMRFFTDISHEIRTPLTMIVSPVENIIEDKKTPSDVKSQLQLILKNANRMLDMVNQILDFRKIQKKKLNIQQTYIGSYIVSICENFKDVAAKQNVTLNLENKANQATVWVDRDSIEKLVFNLLSNALKHTPAGKNVDVIISESKDNTIVLLIKDEGRGMTKEIQNKLFTRFASFNLDKNKPSTGIGLSIVKEVVDKHHAHISVWSEVGKGSSFTIKFLPGLQHFEKDDNITCIDNSAEQEQPLQPPPQESKNEGDTEKTTNEVAQNQTILVVEDDTDLRQFIKTTLEPYYQILEAANGKEGYNMAVTHLPDFVLSDIMMPEMDGVELLQHIRQNAETSHIPLILLTAKTDIESKLSGLDYGADDYITKPFSVKYLRARISNIIEQRRRLYDWFTIVKQTSVSSRQEKPQETQLQITPQDELFMTKVKEIIEKNIDNSDFVVDDLVSELATSRTVFFKKLKSLTGLAPIEFIRDIKIKYAARLIESQQYSIKEVSFMIGISDTKYFTQCFKKIFNMTPSEYKNFKKSE